MKYEIDATGLDQKLQTRKPLKVNQVNQTAYHHPTWQRWNLTGYWITINK